MSTYRYKNPAPIIEKAHEIGAKFRSWISGDVAYAYSEVTARKKEIVWHVVWQTSFGEFPERMSDKWFHKMLKPIGG